MLILSIDSSAQTASAALTEGEKVIKSEFINAGLTHSETLLPMIKRVMQGKDISTLDAIAITAGPGSFTGVRIGVATAKGLAFKNDIPCISVSTLEAIAYNFISEDCIVCAVMDARRMQFYNALFEIKDGKCNRLCEDRAISIEELREEIRTYDKVVVAGDGAKLCYENIKLDNVCLADEEKLYQNAVSIAKAAQSKEKIPAAKLLPIYLRQSQAERELKNKNLKLRRNEK
ncbi:MAG: tRNA (adenosine(37)-N6)-threonylcarbamoyltransferase complex dimerization subunit type 1 TsaB [Eubacterium sp.]|nr:tRNA (adenosine(37)-N6)-threonylcarbamoyltransferase complex dimerization subunit type 1 TsaB [Eubacterium sp.]